MRNRASVDVIRLDVCVPDKNRRLGGAMVNYGRPGPVGAATEETIAEKVDELVRRTGGKK